VLAGDVVIVVAGGAGTLSEVGLALAYEKPVIALKGSGGVADIVAGKVIGGRRVYVANSPDEAVRIATTLTTRT
ncbi:MAG: TIGR00725 family protein, partial [Thermoprotei archaeon]